jgi:hypothetical protein
MLAKAFATGNVLKPNLIFAGKAGAFPNCSCSTQKEGTCAQLQIRE